MSEWMVGIAGVTLGIKFAQLCKVIPSFSAGIAHAMLPEWNLGMESELFVNFFSLACPAGHQFLRPE